MAWMYLGAVALATLWSWPQLDWQHITISPRQWLVLCYLGVIASGLGFYLFNSGARQVSGATLAVMNNGYIPLAVVIAVWGFGETADLTALLLGSVLLGGALLLASRD